MSRVDYIRTRLEARQALLEADLAAALRREKRLRLIVGLRVEKRDYSSRPWRIVTADGRELGEWQAYPGVQGMPPIEVPMCFDRRRDADERLEAIRRTVAVGQEDADTPAGGAA